MTAARGQHIAWLAWAVSLLLAAMVLATRLHVGFDLGLFLPQPQDPAQRVLVERVGEAPGARFLLVAVPNEPERIAALGRDLSANAAFSMVWTGPGDGPVDGRAQALPEPLASHRFLLTDIDWSTAGLRAALRDRLGELGLIGGADYERLVREDPFAAALELLEALAVGRSSQWTLADGRRVLVAETAAPAFDIAAQQQAVEALDAALAQHFEGAATEVTGAGAFGVALQQTIRNEAQWRSLLATVALLAVLWLAYRRFSTWWLAAVPLATGAVLGLAAVALLFPAVHGITLAFGFTLLGVAIDYPLHLLSHARRRPATDAVQRIWPTLRLGAVSTLIAYLALTLAGSEGLSQLGLFTAVGLAAAALTTRFVIPRWVPEPARSRLPPHRPRRTPSLRFIPLVLIAVAGAAALFSTAERGWWSNDLAAMSPVPSERLAADAELRTALGVPDMRHQVVLRERDLETLLQRVEALAGPLRSAAAAGAAGGVRLPTDWLPSAATQRLRQARIPDAGELGDRLQVAVEGTPFRAGAFEPFRELALAHRDRAPLRPAGFSGSPLEGALAEHLYPAEDGWVALISLYPPVDAAALAASIEAVDPAALVVDYRSASEALVRDYRRQTAWMLGGAFVVIAGLLLWRVRARRAAWALGVVAAGLLGTAGALSLLAGPMNLFHMMGLLLIAGLGLDYALFLSRSATHFEDTRHAVFACTASTVAAFGVLAASAIPALASIGTTVALGSALCLLASRTGVGPPATAA